MNSPPLVCLMAWIFKPQSWRLHCFSLQHFVLRLLGCLSYVQATTHGDTVSDCCCDYQTVNALNGDILHPLLADLVRKPFFSYFKVRDCHTNALVLSHNRILQFFIIVPVTRKDGNITGAFSVFDLSISRMVGSEYNQYSVSLQCCWKDPLGPSSQSIDLSGSIRFC
jgi:hypothetical protein